MGWQPLPREKLYRNELEMKLARTRLAAHRQRRRLTIGREIVCVAAGTVAGSTAWAIATFAF